MSQVTLNMRNHNNDEEISFRWSNGTHLAGILFLLGVLLTMFISSWIVLNWMKNAKYLPISKLVVTGKRHYTHNNDIRRLILALGSPGTLINQDVKIIQNQIERLSWIKQVSVRKQWPDELRIHLIEYVPVARWNDKSMVDVDGNPFNVPRERDDYRQDLPKLYGPEGSNNEVLQGFHEMKQMLATHHFKLKDAAMTARRSWQLTLTNGIKLNLGRRDIMKRLSRFVELYPVLQKQAKIDGKRISYVDLRYHSGAAVGWELVPVEIDNQQ